MSTASITEIQNTVTTKDRISGDLVFRFEDIDVNEFYRYRKTIRELVGFGNLGLSKTVINERALVTENNLEKKPEDYRVAQTPPLPQEPGGGFAAPVARLPGQPKRHRSIPYTPPAPEDKKARMPKIHPKMREFLLTFTGKEQQDIIQGYRRRFKHTKISDHGILDMFNAVHNIG